jgi:dipeptidyl aminopeptidase/acylaminoacyl peptidase
MKTSKAWLVLIAVAVAPAFAAQPALTVEDFLTQPNIRDVELSPDGKHLAVILNEGDKRIVVVRNMETPDMPIIGAFQEELVRPSSLYWGNNDRLLIAMSVPWNLTQVRREQDRDDFDINDYYAVSRMISVDKDVTNAVVLLEGDRRLAYNASLSRVTNFLPKKVDHVLMEAYRDGRRVQYEVNIVTGESVLVTRGSERTWGFLNDDSGKPLFRFDYLRIARAIDIFELNEKDRWKRLERIYLDKDDEDSLDRNGLLGLIGTELVYRRPNEQSGFYEIVLVDSESKGERVVASLPDRDIRGVLLDYRADQVVGYLVEEDYLRHVYFDEATQALYDTIAGQIGDYNFRPSSQDAGSRKALVRVWGADDPLSFRLWDTETQQLRHLGSAYRDLNSQTLSSSTIMTIATRDGARMRAYVLFPGNYEPGKPHPLIILPHGGPQSRSRPVYDRLSQFLSTRGYIVAQPNFRGSTGYGRDFEAAGYREWGGVMQDDLADTVDFMVKQGYADPDKVCIVGASYGGYAALMGAIKTPTLYRCAASLNGVTDLVSQVKHDMKNLVDKDDWDRYLFQRIGHPDDDREMLERNSPAEHADKIEIPVLLIAGTEDEIVPFSQAKQMTRALQKAGVKHEFIELEDAGHNALYRREHAETILKALERFLGGVLQGSEAAPDQ